jgi:hypothetical protein
MKATKQLIGDEEMALTSPGVQVTVIDESFYTPAEPGTRPLIIVASAENKTNASGTGVAAGTLKANAGKVYLLTSQRDLAETFGDPTFRVDSNNNPIHAGELNEFGLQAAYSFLGVSNSVFVVRADIDLNKLQPQADAPDGEPNDGTFWLDSGITVWGAFEWNGAALNAGGQKFTSKTPTVIFDTTKLEDSDDGRRPKSSVGAIGDYAIAVGNDADGPDAGSGADFTGNVLRMFYKTPGNTEAGVTPGDWVHVGTDAWKQSFPALTGTKIIPVLAPNDEFIIRPYDSDNTALTTIVESTIEVTGSNLDQLVTVINARNLPGVIAANVNDQLAIYLFGDTDKIEVSNVSGTVLTDLGVAAGSYYAPKVAMSKHTQVPRWKGVVGGAVVSGNTARPTGSIWIKTTEPNAGARIRVKQYDAGSQTWISKETSLYDSNESALADLDASGGGKNIPLNTTYLQYNIDGDTNPKVTFRLVRRISAPEKATVVTTPIITATTFGADSTIVKFAMSSTQAGTSALSADKLISFEQASNATLNAERLAAAINNASVPNVTADVNSRNQVVITHALGGDIHFGEVDNAATLGLLGLGANANVYKDRDVHLTHSIIASGWRPLSVNTDVDTSAYFISSEEPGTTVADGELWYSSVVDEIDLMVHNGEIWVGYLDSTSPYYDGNEDLQTNPTGPIVAASEPTEQTDGTQLRTGDLWIDTSDLENYPVIKRYNAALTTRNKWETLDKSDQTTENGVLFADARWGRSGDASEPALIPDLLTSNYVDFDAPDPALYPRGMLLWNTRRSGFNVKKFVRNYVDLNSDNIRYKSTFNDVGDRPTSGDSQADYYPHRWVTESANQADGSGSFGRKAQRKVVQQALQALVNSNQDIRDTEVRNFNLLAAPGYPELIGEMVSLNYDRGLTAFIVGDTPARLTPDATTLNDWGNNVALALEDNDKGLVSFDEYLGVFYPWGFTSDNAGRDIAVPPSHMILRMIALSDQVSYPWFAPAGTRRGGITNATAVGYVSSEGEFVSVALNEGQRDTLYNVKVNPITFFVGAGLVNFGQKTRARNASALDRINVARLVIYLRSQLNRLAKPYIFEPNDKITRDEIKQQVESLLLELVGQRALYDFLVVCDESNNTPNRIDRNELYVDIAVEPVKAIEFIYIPVRLKNTGEIAGL